MSLNLARDFHENSLRYPENLALSVGGKNFSYSELQSLVQPVASWIRKARSGEAVRVGILASRSLEAILAVLGACWAGATYIPLSPKWPVARLLQVLGLTRLDALIVDASGAGVLSGGLLAYPMKILAPGSEVATTIPEATGRSITVAGRDSLEPFDPHDHPEPVDAGHLPYILFTSGTTGVPKGVMITAEAVHSFLSVMQSRYAIGPTDRVAGNSDIVFDVSVGEMFVTWACGATLLIVPETEHLAPLRFVQKMEPTVWSSVPSVATFMKRIKMLTPAGMPSLRYTLFAGEALAEGTAASWQQAAPNSFIDNLYGPTEATVVCIGQRFSGQRDVTPGRGVVAIGTPFRGTEAAILDPSLNFQAPGQIGEIALAGSQLSVGYFGDPEKTSERFPMIGGKRWYLTGDLGCQDSAGVFHHLGRIDNQIKVRGCRVELEEVEAHLREVSQSDSVAAVAWPVEHGAPSGIVAFVSGKTHEGKFLLRAKMQKRVPDYMVPTDILFIDALPLTVNGKVDRAALVQWLKNKAQ